MPRLFLYEECVAAGHAGPLGAHLSQELLEEGWTMLAALATDFAALDECDVYVARANTVGLPAHAPANWTWVETDADFDNVFAREAAAADWTLLIAPECDGLLAARAAAVLAAGGRLLGPSPSWIDATGDKHRLCEILRAAGVAAPNGTRVSTMELGDASRFAKFRFPVVVKPVDGAGSQETVRTETPERFGANARELATRHPEASLWRVEEFHPGTAVSAAFLCGPAGRVSLPPTRQNIVLHPTGRIAYEGGSIPLDESLTARAKKLGEQALERLPPTCGYVGLDMVLGDACDGSQDIVIEINPRPTVSYVGLRAACRTSLARALLKVATGEKADIQTFADRVEFTTRGTISRMPVSS